MTLCVRPITITEAKAVVGRWHRHNTAPPFWSLRRGATGLGHEPTPQEYVRSLVGVMREVWRVLRDDGTLWLNLGDSYAQTLTGPPMAGGFKRLDLCGIPWRVAMALQEWGWYLRSEIVWWKLGTHTSTALDRPTVAHDQIFLLTKSERYFYRREYDVPSVWGIMPVAPQSDYGYLPLPEEVIENCLFAGCPIGGLVLDPFAGLGTVGQVARQLGRRFIGCEIDADYARLAAQQLGQSPGAMAG